MTTAAIAAFAVMTQVVSWSLMVLIPVVLLGGGPGQWAQRCGGLPRDADQILLQGIRANQPHWIHEAFARGASVDATDADGSTALMWAAAAGDEALVRRLIAGGADLSAKSELNVTPLSSAVVFRQQRVVRLLLEAGAEVDQPSCLGSALHAAVAGLDAGIVAVLLNNGADPNARGERGRTPLMRLYTHCEDADARERTLRLLLSAGADLNAADDDGHTVLMHAASEGGDELTMLLLAAGADPAITDRDGKTAADLARANGHHSMSEMLAQRDVR